MFRLKDPSCSTLRNLFACYLVLNSSIRATATTGALVAAMPIVMCATHYSL